MPYLGVDGAVQTQKGQISVGGGRDDDLDLSFVLKSPEGAEKVLSVDVREIGEARLVKALPSRGQRGHIGLCPVPEGLSVEVAARIFSLMYSFSADLKRGEASISQRTGVMPTVKWADRVLRRKRSDQIEKRNVGLGDRFTEPIASVGPFAVGEDIRQVAVKH